MAIQINHAASLACFVTSFALEGIQRCSGIFFSWTLDQSEESRQKVAVPFVVSRATAYIISVVFKDFLQNRSVETFLQCGVFLGILGAALSFISSDLIWMTICWGIIFGAGIGISSPEPLKVSQKFRTQPFILLICCAAPSFATIFLPYFLQFLLSCYGLCGCLLIVSGITLNTVPFIMVASYRIRFQLRKPLWRIRKKYEISNIESCQKTKEKTSDGIDNECFEIDTSSIPNESGVEMNSNTRKNNLPHSNIFPTEDINPYGNDQKAAASIGNTERGHGTDFDTNFSDEEDVLFASNISINRSDCCESDFKNAPSDSTERTRRKDTIVNSLPKQCMNALSSQHETGAKQLRNALTHANLPNHGVVVRNDKLSDAPAIHSCGAKTAGYPLEIKVHVVECTFTEDDVRDGRLLTQSVPNIKRNGYRRHSNSLITNNNFPPPNFSKIYNKPSSIYGRSTSPNMYLISEDDELAVDAPSRSDDAVEIGQQSKRTASSLKKVFKPTCLIVIYAFVIHEVTLVTLLTIFDDHIDGLVSPATGVLPAFGLGGILGRLSVRYWGDRMLLEGSHATAALLFILDGIVVAGILWSPNIYWIGGFYATVGFLEIGISTAVWNLVCDHIEVDAKPALFTTCKLLCGICSLFVPYTIGLSRDVMGEYDGLLQITSGLSVLCAILCYILPKFALHTKHTRGS